MSKIRFISDLHFSHHNMAIKRGFKDSHEHDEHIIECWNKVVNKRDTTYILGDITMEKKSPYNLLNRLNGIKYVVLGNHDRRQDVEELLKYVNGVAGMINYKNVILTHCPIHPCELVYRFSHNIHGHVHENTIPDSKYINVSCEVVDYTPKLLEELIEVDRTKRVLNDALNWAKSQLAEEEVSKLGKTMGAYRTEKIMFLRKIIKKLEDETI